MAVFTNQATLSYSGGVTNSNITTGELVETVSVSKQAVTGSYAPGESVVYVVSIVNNGAADLTNITVSDDLGGCAYGGGTVYPLSYVEDSLLYYVDGALQTAPPAVTAGPDTPMEVSGLNIPAGSNVTLIYEADVTRYAPLGADAQITNTVSVTGAGSELTASAVVPMEGEAELTISKSLCTSQVAVNGQIAYDFVIQNAGSRAAEAADEVSLTDVFTPALNGLTVTCNGETWTEGTQYTYDQATGTFTTIPGQITVPAAVYSRNADGSWTVTPGVSVLTVTGTV